MCGVNAHEVPLLFFHSSLSLPVGKSEDFASQTLSFFLQALHFMDCQML